MAYVLGLTMADGAIEDVRKSSRTCYFMIASNDLDLLEQVKIVMNSNHEINSRKPRYVQFEKKMYLCKISHRLRIGSKEIYNDLENLGVASKKALRLMLPEVPNIYFQHYLRGYFDGDGCFSAYKRKDSGHIRPRVIFTSGCKSYLENLQKNIQILTDITTTRVYLSGNRAFQSIYSDQNAVKIMDYMYQNLDQAPYLDRKYKKYLDFKNNFGLTSRA